MKCWRLRDVVGLAAIAVACCSPTSQDGRNGDVDQGSDPRLFDADELPGEPPTPPDCEDPGPTDDPLRLGRLNTLELVTWNLHNFPAAAQTVTRLAALITRLDVDFVGVQEISDVAAFADLLAALPGYSGVTSPDDYGNGTYQKTGYVWRSDTFTLVDSTSLFGTHGYVFPRPPFQARFDVLLCSGAVERVTAIDVHLKADPDAESVTRRKDAVSMLKSYVDGLVAQGSTNVVVLGDFNDSVSDATADNIFNPFLDDATDYTVATQSVDDGSEYTYIPFTSFLDHLVVTRGLADASVTSSTSAVHLDLLVSAYNYETQISDHRPVISILPR